HYKFDALRTRFAHVLKVRHRGQLFRILGEAIEERLVEFLIDQAGTWPGNLVRHSAGAEYHHAQVVRIGRDRLADGAAEIEAALAGGRRVLHHVDGERDNWAGPCLGRAEHEIERHREAVIDFHLVDDGEIEPVENRGCRD